jgi:hypothetical protein
MTKNRARIRATKALAASSDIRHPEASYLADHRKLRLPDGTIHDFSEGPLRYLGIPGSGVPAAALATQKEATAKGWATHFYDATEATTGFDPHDFLWHKGPAVFIVDANHETGTALHKSIDDLDAGSYPDLNVVIVREPIPGEHRRTPATGRNIHLAAAAPGQVITGHPGIHRTARGWALVEAADAALDALGVPKAAQEFATHTSGLFLVTGMTGAGKTMTATSLLRRAYYDKGHAAAAIMHPFERGLVSDFDVSAFPVEYAEVAAPAIREAVAAGAKIILVEELHHPAAIEAALDAALGGALVIATMHGKASDASQRLLDAFPESGSPKIRAKVLLALRGVIEQVLVRRADDKGRVLASEVWAEDGIGTGAVLAPVITLKESLKALYEQGAVDPESMEKALFHRW